MVLNLGNSKIAQRITLNRKAKIYSTHQLNGTRVVFPLDPMLTFGLAKLTNFFVGL